MANNVEVSALLLKAIEDVETRLKLLGGERVFRVRVPYPGDEGHETSVKLTEEQFALIQNHVQAVQEFGAMRDALQSTASMPIITSEP